MASPDAPPSPPICPSSPASDLAVASPSISPLVLSKVLVATFEVMEARGEAVMRPFLQDVLRVDGLVATIGGLMLSSPLVAVEILVRLGPVPLADWFLHFGAMVFGSAVAAEPVRPLIKGVAAALPPAQGFAAERFVEGWQYGSGLDYTPPTQPTPMQPEALAVAKRAAAKARAYRPSAPAVETAGVSK